MKYREMIICFLIYTILNNKSVGLPPHTIRTDINKNKITSVGKNVEKLEPLYNVGVNVICCSHHGKHMDIPQ